MSDVEVGRIYAEVGADIADFLAGMDMVSQSMRDTAASLTGDAAEMDAALSSTGHEAGSMGRNVAEGAAEAAAAMTGAAADVTGDAVVMAHEFDNVGDQAAQMGRKIVESAAEGIAAVTAETASVVAGCLAMAAGFVWARVSAVSFMAVLIGLAVALATVAVAAAPFAAAMAGILALGSLDRVFKMGKNGPVLIGEWKKIGKDIFDTLHQISLAVSKPLFTFLLAELKQLDKWVHTASFKKDMKELGKAMLEAGHDAVIAVKWIHDNWASIQSVLLKILNVAKLVGEGFAWLARTAAKYWPEIKRDAEIAYNWFMQNLWPGMKRGFHAIALDVTNLAHGFQQAWPQIQQALSSAWSVMKPMLALLVAELGAVQTALQWLSKNSGPAIGALASAISSELAGVASIISGVASALQTVVSALQDAKSVLGMGGSSNGVNGTSGAGGGRFGGVVHPATGGLIRGGTPGRDSVPALLTPGELVLNSEQQKKIMQGGGGGPQNWGGARHGSGGGYVRLWLSDTELAALTRRQGRHTARMA